MTHVITRSCCSDAACVPVCPVNCIHPTPEERAYATTEMLYIDPVSCIDCGACVDVCPVNAIVPDYDLPAKDEVFLRLNELYYEGDGRTGYVRERARPAGSAVEQYGPLKIVVVGSGPAALYAAEDLLGRRGLDVSVDIIERLPVVGGLVRYGVAPDHQDTKAAETAFARTMRRPNLRLLLNTEVGSDVTSRQLSEHYHAVLYAYGAGTSKALCIPGEELDGSHSATEFVAWYNGYPDQAEARFDLSGERVVVVGNGNVALDVARILVSGSARLERTDIADHALVALRASAVEEVVLVARRGPAESAFTAKELLSLIALEDVDVVVDTGGRSVSDAVSDPLIAYKVELLAGLPTADTPRAPGRRRIVLKYFSAPESVGGRGRVEAIMLQRMQPVGDGVFENTSEIETLVTGLVLRSVGYRGVAIPGLPFDDVRGLVPNEGGRVLAEPGGAPVPGAYVTGWIKRGPSGVIGTNKQCARETVAAILEDYQADRLPLPAAHAEDIADAITNHLDLAAWKRIDAYEKNAGKAERRPRVKVTDLDELLKIGRGQG
ncbi:FAD-dependent oxidoreductase [Nocardia sp. NPDC005366]|uniref:FAD-dependent oxidoreductase n=1 Tax=Nocardia sp. NPDC005366 TaxID=3156878 RepID=UPI0033A459C9